MALLCSMNDGWACDVLGGDTEPRTRLQIAAADRESARYDADDARRAAPPAR